MSRLLLVLLLAPVFVAGCRGGCSERTENRADSIRERILSREPGFVLVVAHRGDWRYAPENSIAAIEHSISVGVDIVELDLQMTRDSVLILMHDATLNRTTTGKGRVCDWTMDSIRTLKLKNGCGIRTKHQVPTLEEALLAAKGRVLLNLDKADRYFGLIVPILERTGMSRHIIMKGGRPADEVLADYGDMLGEIIYMPVVNIELPGAEALIEGFLSAMKPAAYEIVYAGDDGLARRTRSRLDGEALIWYNTLWDSLCGGHDDDLSLEDPDAAFGYLIDELGADIIQTDRAEHLLKYLRDKGLHD